MLDNSPFLENKGSRKRTTHNDKHSDKFCTFKSQPILQRDIKAVEDGNHKKDQNSHFPMKPAKLWEDLRIDPVDQTAGGIENQTEYIFSQRHKPRG